MVVREAVRCEMEAQGFNGMTFRPVVMARIVRLEWHLWDKSAEEPEAYPESGEPEDYILQLEHSSEVSRAMGQLWEVVPTGVPGLQLRGGALAIARHPGADLCANAPSRGYLFASQVLKDWLAKNLGGWVRFEQATLG